MDTTVQAYIHAWIKLLITVNVIKTCIIYYIFSLFFGCVDYHIAGFYDFKFNMVSHYFTLYAVVSLMMVLLVHI